MEQLEKIFSWKCKKLCKTINQLRGVTVDGGKNMAGVRKGLVGQIRTQLEDLQIPGALFIHCIIHQPGALFIHCIIHQPGALFIHCIIHQPGALFMHCIIHQPGALFIHLHHTSAGRSVHTLHHTSASPLWERLRYFLCTETSRFCCELHSGTCTQSPSVPGFS